MQLTASTFEQVVRSLRSDSASARDQRGEPRVGLRARTKIFPMVVDDRGSQPLDVGVRDLSVTGIGLTAPRPLPRGSLFLLRLAQPDGSNLELAYKITYANQTSGGTYVLGAVRQTPLPASARPAGGGASSHKPDSEPAAA